MAGALPPALVDALTSALTARPEIQEAYLFGSGAGRAASALSDVDVAVWIDPADTPPSSRYGYAADLATDLGTTLGRSDVDVVVLNDAPPLLYHRAIARGVRLCSRDLCATTTREGRALSRYCDYLPQLQIVDTALRDRLRAGTFGR